MGENVHQSTIKVVIQPNCGIKLRNPDLARDLPPLQAGDAPLELRGEERSIRGRAWIIFPGRGGLGLPTEGEKSMRTYWDDCAVEVTRVLPDDTDEEYFR